MTRPTVDIFADLEAVSQAAADLYVDAAVKAVRNRGWFAVALSGGGTPQRTLELLAETPRRDRAPWAQTHVFWGDERCVPPGDPRSNVSMARAALLDRLSLPPRQIHPIDCAGAPAAGASRYEVDLRNFFGAGAPRFDLIFLGLGADGHTASLFPFSPALHETERWTAATTAPDGSTERVTLTPPIINRAALIAFLAAGGEKADALRLVVEGGADPDRFPAAAIRPLDGELRWLVDRGAARGLAVR
jgi:6-phosphogluconolactonase